MKSTRRVVILLTVALAISTQACQRQTGSNEGDSDFYTGYIEADLVYISAPSSGWLTTSSVREGDMVAPNDLLFELEAELQSAQFEEAGDRLRQSEAQARDLATGARPAEVRALEGQLEEAKTVLDLAAIERQRIVKLVEQGILPQERADQAVAEHEAAKARVSTLEANIEVARLTGREATREAARASTDAAAAAVRQARWRLEERMVEARVGGRVEEIFHRPGEFVAAGSPVLALLPEASLEVRFFVPQKHLSSIATGSSVEVRVDGQAEPVNARVSYIARQAEFTPPVIYSASSRDKLVFLVRAKFEGASQLRPGQPVDVRVL